MNKTIGLNVPSGLCVFEKTKLAFLRNPTWEEWKQLMEYLSHCRHASLRWMADARGKGRKIFGDDEVATFLQQLQFNFSDLNAADALEKLETRCEGLTDAHHQVVASGVDDPEDRVRWLKTAEEKHLSPKELRASISGNRVITEDEVKARSAGVATIEGVRTLFLIWSRQVRDDWRGWDIERKRRLLAEILPICMLGDEIREDISALMEKEQKAAKSPSKPKKRASKKGAKK